MLNQRPVLPLKIASLFISQVIAVNQKLKTWAKDKLYCRNVIYLPNFISISNSMENWWILKIMILMILKS